MSIAVLGAGAFGAALAISFAEQGTVTLWARNPDDCADMALRRVNRHLPNAKLPQTVVIEPDLEAACRADVILLAIPTQRLAAFVAQHLALLAGKHLVACCKGIDLATGRSPTQILTEAAPRSVSILTGPSFAVDIAVGLPTALTLAGDHADLESLQQALSCPNLRMYRSRDVVGAELGGALKNVVAIACGAAMGARLGESARAAVMTRGYAEMQRFAMARGAQAQTLAGLSGFGDLALTCTSERSRNYRYGMALGAGQSFDQSTTVEGAATARAIAEQAVSENIEMPIATAVAAVLAEKITVAEAMNALLARPLKEE